MSVSNYNRDKCKYTYSKLKNVVYLLSKEHVKTIHIENTNTYIDELSELPLRLNGFSISLKEETSLDERYEFQKTVTLSMHGYVNHKIFSDRYYVILESEDGTFWMVNVDFPSRVTYTFNLSKDTYQTDFTFSSLSNYPTMRLFCDFEAVEPVCLGFNVYGIDSLRMIEKNLTTLDTRNKVVYTYGNTFKDIEFLGDSCAYSSIYDGFNVTETITFDISFDSYKSSWHYNLIEFVKNLYSAIIVPKSSTNTFYIGFNHGLQPSFTVQTSDSNDGTDIITITLREMSGEGLTAAQDWLEEQSTETRWVYIKQEGNVICWECAGAGKARYLVQKEVLANGSSTGNYKAKNGYEAQFDDVLNVVGTFDNEQLFDESTCTGEECPISTDIPLNLVFTSVTCYTYSIRSGCDWEITDLPSYITASPSSGSGETTYSVSICNTQTPSGTTNASFNIESGNNVRVVNVTVTDNTGILIPSSVNIDCLAQNVSFVYNSTCPITVTSMPSNLTYNLTNSQLIVNVPQNYTTSARTFSITVKDCNNNTQTVTINQDKTYEAWVTIEGYTCVDGDSYTIEQRYTGTTSASTNTITDEKRAGTLIQSGDSRCSSYSIRWTASTYYICIDGDKWSFEEEEISYDNGTSWTKTGNIRPLEMVESASTFCSSAATYEWRLTDKWECSSE